MVFETKDFMNMEKEEKYRILELYEKAYEGRDFESEIQVLEEEKQGVLAGLSEITDKLTKALQRGLDEKYLDENILNQVKLELESLKKQAGAIVQKTAELEKHKHALEIKTAINRKKLLTSEIESLSKELELLRESKVERENTLVEIKANFDSFYKSYNEEMSRLMYEEKKLLNNLVNSEKNELSIFDGFKVNEKLTKITNEIIASKEKLERLKEKCLSVEVEISEKKELIGELVLPEERKEVINQAKDLESEIIIYDNMLKLFDKLIDDVKEDLAEAKAIYSSELAKSRKIEEDLEKIDKSTTKVFENSELTNFEKLRSCDKSLADIYVVEYEVSLIDKQIEEIKLLQARRIKKAEEIREKVADAERVLEEKLDIVRNCKNFLKEREEEREEMLGSNYLSMLVSYTNVGDECPVCGSVVNRKHYTEKCDLAAIEKEIEMAKGRVGYAEKDKEYVVQTIAALKANLEFLVQELSDEKSKIDELEKSKIKVYQRVIDVNDKMLENFTGLKSALKKTSVALEDLINLQSSLRDTVQDNISKRSEYGSRIGMLSEKHEQLLDLYYVLQKDRAERELLLLEAKAAISEANFDEERIAFSEKQQLQTIACKEIMELYEQLGELKTAILVEQENLCKLESEKISLEKNVTCDTRTEGVIDGENMTAEEIREKTERLMETHDRLINLKKEAEYSLQNTIKDYEVKTKVMTFKQDELQDVSALVSSLMSRYNFTSDEEVSSYITTDNMIKMKESEIKNYNASLSKLEAQYALMVNGNEKVSNVSDFNMSEIKKEQEQNMIRLGELNVKIENLKHEQRKFNEVLRLKKMYE